MAWSDSACCSNTWRYQIAFLLTFVEVTSVIISKVVASRFQKNNSVNVFSYQYAYRFMLIFLLAILITRLMNKILLNYFPPG